MLLAASMRFDWVLPASSVHNLSRTPCAHSLSWLCDLLDEVPTSCPAYLAFQPIPFPWILAWFVNIFYQTPFQDKMRLLYRWYCSRGINFREFRECEKIAKIFSREILQFKCILETWVTNSRNFIPAKRPDMSNSRNFTPANNTTYTVYDLDFDPSRSS